MVDYSEDTTLLPVAIGALAALGIANDVATDNQNTIATQGGLDLIFQAMRRFPTDCNLLTSAVQASLAPTPFLPPSSSSPPHPPLPLTPSLSHTRTHARIIDVIIVRGTLSGEIAQLSRPWRPPRCCEHHQL